MVTASWKEHFETLLNGKNVSALSNRLSISADGQAAGSQFGGSFSAISRPFRRFQGILQRIVGRFGRSTLREFQGCFRGIPSKAFRKVSRGFRRAWNFRVLSKVFQAFLGTLKNFQENYREVSDVFALKAFQGVSEVIKGVLEKFDNGFLEFQEAVNGISESVQCVSRGFSLKLSGL